MKVLDKLVVRHGGNERTIELCSGDLTAFVPEDLVDFLIVSAFPNNYAASTTSLIGALNRSGVSVGQLANSKQVDLRSSFHCWLSSDLRGSHVPDFGFRRILCFEPPEFGRPPEIVGDIFRSLAPFAIGEYPECTVAMPIVASGDQGWPAEEMLWHILEAATHWLGQGLPVRNLKIVELSPTKAARLMPTFASFHDRLDAPAPSPHAAFRYDAFVSYSWRDLEHAQSLARILREHAGAKVFMDQINLDLGRSWQEQIYESLDASAKIIALISPSYVESKVCKEEFNIAMCRERESDGGILIPIYLRTANLPTYMKLVQHIDCREADADKLNGVGARIFKA